MTDETEQGGETNLFPKTVGERLRDARTAQKLELSDIAQRTRVPLRHLQAIEDGDYSGLPSSTYAVGFARAYARTVGLDDVEVAREVRGKSEATAAARYVPDYQAFDLEDTPRTPSRGVMMAAIVLALLCVVGVGLWYGTTWFRGDGLSGGDPAPAPSFTPEAAAPSPVASIAPNTAGQVTLVANDEVWLRVYDAANQTLLMKTMAPGERYDVPPTADRPMINVGRPDKLQVLVNGTAQPPLGTGRVAIKDVGISAAALAARNAPAGTPTAPVATPTTGSAAPLSTASPRAGRTTPPFFRDATPAAGQPQGPAPVPTQAAPAPTPVPTPPPAGNGL